jgi:hypothetical protein
MGTSRFECTLKNCLTTSDALCCCLTHMIAACLACEPLQQQVDVLPVLLLPTILMLPIADTCCCVLHHSCAATRQAA